MSINNNNNQNFMDDLSDRNNMKMNNNQIFNNNMLSNNINQQINNNINFNDMINNNNMNNNLNMINNMDNMNNMRNSFQNGNNLDSNFKMYFDAGMNNKNNNNSNLNDIQIDENMYEPNESDGLTGKAISVVFPENSLKEKETSIIQKGNFPEDKINNIKKICFSYFDFSKPYNQINADKISQMLKQAYENEEWFVLFCKKSPGDAPENFDFKCSYLENKDTLILYEKEILFYICKL